MWARICELCTAVWILLSRMIFNYPTDQAFLRVNDICVSVLIALFSLLSFHKNWEKMHLGNFLVAIWLIFIAFSFPDPKLPPPLQSYLVNAFLLLMFGVIPCGANKPPKAWRNYNK
jgi:hypothetical protein